MKKNRNMLLIVTVVIIMLTVSVLLLSTPEKFTASGDEVLSTDKEASGEPLVDVDEMLIPDNEMLNEPVITDIEAIIPDNKTPEEPAIDYTEILATYTIDFNGKIIPLTESVEAITEDLQLKEDNFEICKWETCPDDTKMVDRNTALNVAITEVQGLVNGQAYAD